MENTYIMFVFLLLIQCTNHKKPYAQSSFIHHKSDSILYTGRINHTDSTSIIYWQGSSIKLNFKGDYVKILIHDEYGKNYYNVILDQDSIILFHPDSVKRWYTLVSGIENKNHSLEFFKRTEWIKGATYIYGFELAGGAELLAPPQKPKKTIEFFGNSITCGYAIEDADTIEENPDSIYTNNYLTYAAITARHFNANYYNTARSGIGITISWFPMIMDDLYYRLNPADSSSRWDFTKYQPDVVVINLFQNDSWLVESPDYPEFKHRFGTKKPNSDFFVEKYKEFVLKIRKVYPNANIICALGPMDAVEEGSPWPNYIKIAVSELNDDKIYTLFFPFQNTELHPKIDEHQKMAKQLIRFIEDNKLLE